jgi:hypothetical protein
VLPELPVSAIVFLVRLGDRATRRVLSRAAVRLRDSPQILCLLRPGPSFTDLVVARNWLCDAVHAFLVSALAARYAR